MAFQPGTLAKRLRMGGDNGLAAVSSLPITKVAKQYKLFQREALDKPPIIHNELSLQQKQIIGEVARDCAIDELSRGRATGSGNHDGRRCQ